MPQKLLENLQAHPGIEQLRGKRVAQAVNRIALLVQPGFAEILDEAAPCRTVAKAAMVLSIKEIGFFFLP